MTAFLTIFEAGLSAGSMYAAAAIGLALLWGALRMLNMAQGMMLTIGAYGSYSAVEYLGVPWWAGLPCALVVGFVAGVLLYAISVRWMYKAAAFETNIVIATVGISILAQSLLIKIFTGYAKKQPFLVDHGLAMANVTMRYQTLINLGIAVVMMLVLAWFLSKTRTGKTIRAVAQDREAAQLMGVPVARVFLQCLAIAGIAAAASGVVITAVTPMSHYVGHEPFLKAFIICVIAGLGNIPAAFGAAFVLGWFEAFVEYIAGARWGFPALLLLVIVVLLWRPYGVFGARRVARV